MNTIISLEKLNKKPVSEQAVEIVERKTGLG